MNDDLGRHLRDEVPPPRAGYWEAVDAGLQNISEENSDTTDVVVRPIGMNERRNDLSSRLIAAAAAIAVIAGAGVFFATRDDGTVETDVATEINAEINAEIDADDGSTTTVDSAPDTTIEGDSVTTTETPVITTVGPAMFPDLPDGVGRRCYVDFVVGEWALVAELSDDGTLRAASVNGDGEVVVTSTGARFGVDGWYVMSNQEIGATRPEYVAAWFVGEEGVSQGEDAGYEATPCTPENENLVKAAVAAQGAEAPPVADPVLAPGSTCYANRSGHPGADWARIVVNDDLEASYVARFDFDDGSTLFQTGPGSFVSDTELALDLRQPTNPGEEDFRQTVVMQVEDGGLRHGLGFFSEGADCAEVDPQLVELDAN